MLHHYIFSLLLTSCKKKNLGLKSTVPFHFLLCHHTKETDKLDIQCIEFYVNKFHLKHIFPPKKENFFLFFFNVLLLFFAFTNTRNQSITNFYYIKVCK